MNPIPIDNLFLKGGHNSYDARMHRTIDQQIDDFGVWGVELDFGVFTRNDGTPFAVIGHDSPGQSADFPPPVLFGFSVLGGDPEGGQGRRDGVAPGGRAGEDPTGDHIGPGSATGRELTCRWKSCGTERHTRRGHES